MGQTQNFLTQNDQSDQDQIAADNIYRDKMGGITDKYTGNNQSIMDVISPMAKSDPINIKFGDFSMPFTTGTQASARNRYVD